MVTTHMIFHTMCTMSKHEEHGKLGSLSTWLKFLGKTEFNFISSYVGSLQNQCKNTHCLVAVYTCQKDHIESLYHFQTFTDCTVTHFKIYELASGLSCTPANMMNTKCQFEFVLAGGNNNH